MVSLRDTQLTVCPVSVTWNSVFNYNQSVVHLEFNRDPSNLNHKLIL